MMYGGLRGAVAFALVLLIDPKVCFHSSQWQGAQLGELILKRQSYFYHFDALLWCLLQKIESLKKKSCDEN